MLCFYNVLQRDATFYRAWEQIEKCTLIMLELTFCNLQHCDQIFRSLLRNWSFGLAAWDLTHHGVPSPRCVIGWNTVPSDQSKVTSCLMKTKRFGRIILSCNNVSSSFRFILHLWLLDDWKYTSFYRVSLKELCSDDFHFFATRKHKSDRFVHVGLICSILAFICFLQM